MLTKTSRKRYINKTVLSLVRKKRLTVNDFTHLAFVFEGEMLQNSDNPPDIFSQVLAERTERKKGLSTSYKNST